MLKCSNSGGKGIQRPLIETADNDSLRLAVERGSSTNLPNGDTDTVGTSGHQRERCRHFHENALLHKAPVSPLTMVHVGASRNDNSQAVLNVEFHRHCVTCANCNFVDTGHVLSVVCSCRMSQAFAFSVLLSCMRIAEARAEIASAILLVEINISVSLWWLQASFVCSSCAGHRADVWELLKNHRNRNSR